MSRAVCVSFCEFLVIWNTAQGGQTPRLHLRIAKWIEEAWESGEVRILLMAFRSAGKSTIVGVFAAWLLYRNADIRILVLAAEQALARKMVRNVKRIIERHPLTRGMRPKNADQWASDSFTVRRASELRDPSMMARGVTANITGSRADVVICDDVEVPNTCDTAVKREELRLRLCEMAYVLTAGGRQIYVGTPHHYYSIYADKAREEIGEEHPFLQGFARLSVPIVGDDGVSAWPERYDARTIERMRAEAGQNKFDSQMMLRAVNIMNARLDVELLQYYNSEITYCPLTDRLFIGHLQVDRAAGYWDPALGRAGGDGSVFAVVLRDVGGNLYLHHMEYMKVDPACDETEVAQQCKVAEAMIRRFHLKRVKCEGNGLGATFAAELRKRVGRDLCAVVDESSKTNKDMRILNAVEPVMAKRVLFVHENIRRTPFLMEMREWRPGGRGRDDGLDALAGALGMLGAGGLDTATMTAQGWHRGHGRIFRAKTVCDD